MGATYGQRPSAILGIEDERLAYDFDLSVALISLGQDQQAKDESGQFADIKAAFAAKRGK